VPHNDRFGGLEIDSQFEFYRLLDRQNGGFRPVEDFVHVEPDLMKQSRQGNDERSATYIDRDRAGLRLQRLENGKALSRARELAALYLKAPEVTRRDTRIHFIQPLKERIVREVGYGLSLEGTSSAALMRSRVKNEAA